MRKWKPTKAQRKEFAQKMQDPEYEKAYLQRKEKRAASRRKNSDYDYSSAGGLTITVNGLDLINKKHNHERVLA